MLEWLAVPETDLPADDSWMTTAERARLARMRYTKRRDEFRLGRWSAKRAIAHRIGTLDVESVPDHPALAAIEVRNAVDGAPAPFVDGAPWDGALSMTDRAGWAACLVGPAGLALGCDLELVEPRSRRFVDAYFTVAEQQAVAAAAEWDLAANLVWSAKESALKVLRTGLRRPTPSVEVAVADGGGGWAALTVTATGSGAFPGWWARFGAFVITVAADVPASPPTAMFDESVLGAATPRHTWIERPLHLP